MLLQHHWVFRSKHLTTAYYFKVLQGVLKQINLPILTYINATFWYHGTIFHSNLTQKKHARRERYSILEFGISAASCGYVFDDSLHQSFFRTNSLRLQKLGSSKPAGVSHIQFCKAWGFWKCTRYQPSIWFLSVKLLLKIGFKRSNSHWFFQH